MPKEDIRPANLMLILRNPNVGNHLKYKFMKKKELQTEKIKNGEIHVDNSVARFAYLYLEI